MIRSMTGYGRGEAVGDVGKIVVEAKAVNHRFSEVVCRMPRQFNALEEQAKKQVLARVSRGRIDVFVSWEPAAKARGVQVDKTLAMAYYSALKELGEEIGSKSELTLDTLAKLPDVLKVEEGEIAAGELAEPFATAVSLCVDSLLAMREREGATLAADLLSRIDRIEEISLTIAERAPLVAEEYRARLVRRLEELLPQGNTVDPQRLAQEVAIFADRSDITEEIQRLGSHLAQFRSIVAAGDSVGRKLDFLVQEIGREINTIGSKANDVTITNQVVDGKSELERIREQVQNIE